ncbi:MAG: hypothetical protein KAI86_07625, partial [Desulfobacterales bacterium]|nr:hypothetical protein [Desulfobacterales bacterium]
MKKRESLFGLAGILVMVIIVSICTIAAQEVMEEPSDTSETRADVINIDTLKGFGVLERPEV